MIPQDAALEAASTLGQAARWDEAETMCRMALMGAPSARAEYMLGVILAARARQSTTPHDRARALFDDAIAAYRRALSIDPAHEEALNNLGSLLLSSGQHAAALDCFVALAQRAPNAKRLVNLSMTAFSLGRQHLALAAAAEAERLEPDFAEAVARKGSALSQIGHIEEARQAFERALELDPGHREAVSSLVYLADFDRSITIEDHIRLRQRWLAQRFPNGLPSFAPHANDRNPDRPLKIGYLSADFRRHSATLAFAPVVMNHDPSQFSVHLYSSTIIEDELTAQYRNRAALFRDIRHQSDTEAASAIRADGIDILIDLSGHLANERLGLLSMKPAPVQMTGWGAVTGTGTGLNTIDYLLADAVTAPEMERAAFAERIIELPSILPYTVMDGTPPLAPAPGLARGAFTFGSLNRIVKVWPSLPLYARVLDAVPGSRLLLKAIEFDTEEARRDVTERMAGLGIGAERLSFMGMTAMQAHLAAFNEIDLVLDPVPHTGGVTALDGLLMGVPAVTLKSVGISGKLTSSFQHLLGLDEFITTDDDAYIACARHWAARPDELSRLRPQIRDRFLKSVMTDAKAYTATVEAAYRRAWQDWCKVR